MRMLEAGQTATVLDLTSDATELPDVGNEPTTPAPARRKFFARFGR